MKARANGLPQPSALPVVEVNELVHPRNLCVSHESGLAQLQSDICDIRAFLNSHCRVEGLFQGLADSDYAVIWQQQRPAASTSTGDELACTGLCTRHLLHHRPRP